MEKHQILRPKQVRGTPAQTVLFKLGLAGCFSTIIGFYISDYFRLRRHLERYESGQFLPPDHIRWNNLMMGRLLLTDSTTAAVIRKNQDESQFREHQLSSNAPPLGAAK